MDFPCIGFFKRHSKLKGSDDVQIFGASEIEREEMKIYDARSCLKQSNRGDVELECGHTGTRGEEVRGEMGDEGMDGAWQWNLSSCSRWNHCWLNEPRREGKELRTPGGTHRHTHTQVKASHVHLSHKYHIRHIPHTHHILHNIPYTTNRITLERIKILHPSQTFTPHRSKTICRWRDVHSYAFA